MGQIPLDVKVPAYLLNGTSDTVLTCNLPETHFLGKVALSLSLNGQDFGPVFQTFEYTGLLPHRVIFFGGFNGQFWNDIHVLYLGELNGSFKSELQKMNVILRPKNWVD